MGRTPGERAAQIASRACQATTVVAPVKERGGAQLMAPALLDMPALEGRARLHPALLHLVASLLLGMHQHLLRVVPALQGAIAQRGRHTQFLVLLEPTSQQQGRAPVSPVLSASTAQQLVEQVLQAYQPVQMASTVSREPATPCQLEEQLGDSVRWLTSVSVDWRRLVPREAMVLERVSHRVQLALLDTSARQGSLRQLLARTVSIVLLALLLALAARPGLTHRAARMALKALISAYLAQQGSTAVVEQAKQLVFVQQVPFASLGPVVRHRLQEDHLQTTATKLLSLSALLASFARRARPCPPPVQLALTQQLDLCRSAQIVALVRLDTTAVTARARS